MAHSDFYSKTRLDTRKAWEASHLSRLFKRDKVGALRQSLGMAGPGELAELFMQISYAPFSGAVAAGLDDGKAGKLSQHLLTAILVPFVTRRSAGDRIDLSQLQDAIIRWVDSGSLGGELDADAADLARITELLGSVEPRIALTSPFAAPIEFSILAIEHFERSGAHLSLAEKVEFSDV